jgi:hypothetical protein
MKSALLLLFKCLPLIMGLGFVAPLIGQSLLALGVERLWSVPALYLGIAIGGIWGGVATKTGRWI